MNESLTLLKESVSRRLAVVDVKALRLSRTDARLETYVREVIARPEGHNVYEQLAVERFIRLLGRYEFRPSEVKRFIVFYERLKFSGQRGRVRYRLTPIQVFQFASILGFWRTPGKRLVRDALLFVPRKFSKTTSVAALAIYDLLFGDANAQAYVAANSYDQAQVCFGEIRNILRAMDPSMHNFKVNREQVFNRRRGRTSFARCLASNPDKLDGLNASMVILDEYSQADSPALKNVLTSSMGSRVNPLTVVITTASDKLEGPFVEMLEGYKAVLRGETDNDTIFAHIFQPDEGDDEGSPATWAKVQPHLGVTVQPDFYELEWQKALLSADDMLTFRTKLLNLFVQSEARAWFTAGEVEALGTQSDARRFTGRPLTMAAVDLSVCDDFSCVCYNTYIESLHRFHVRLDYYIPEATLRSHPNRELYRRWVEQGYMRALPGEVIDYKLLAGDILAMSRVLTIARIGYDPYKSREFVNIMGASAPGASQCLVPVSQTYGTFTSPVETFEIAAKTGRVSFERNPVTWYCFGNAVMDEDKMENRKPLKRSKNEKIDGVITTLMTFHLYNNFER